MWRKAPTIYFMANGMPKPPGLRLTGNMPEIMDFQEKAGRCCRGFGAFGCQTSLQPAKV
jgi:hypothetical protein